MACMQKSLYRKSMGNKKELDNLSLDMIQCKKDGFGCNYGEWKATQSRPVVIEKKEIEPKFGYGICKHCGKQFIKTSNIRRFYCDSVCQHDAQVEKRKEKRREYFRAYAERKRTEQKGA